MKRIWTAAATDPGQDRALTGFKASYGEARELVSSAEPCANLDWVFGADGDSDKPPPRLDRKMIPLLTLWLQDLAAEVERALSQGPPGETDSSPSPAHPARESLAERLREATEGLVAALRRPA